MCRDSTWSSAGADRRKCRSGSWPLSPLLLQNAQLLEDELPDLVSKVARFARRAVWFIFLSRGRSARPGERIVDPALRGTRSRCRARQGKTAKVAKFHLVGFVVGELHPLDEMLRADILTHR